MLRSVRGNKNSALNRRRTILLKMFNVGISEGVCINNPCEDVEIHREDNYRTRVLSKDEEKRLFKVLNTRYWVKDKKTKKKKMVKPYLHLKRIVYEALKTGKRRQEIFDICYSNLDFEKNEMHILNTKTNEKRIIPINSKLKRMYLGIQKNATSDYVHVNPKTGLPYTNIKNGFKTVLEKAGIEGFTFHDLRHTFATRAIERGVDVETLRQLLGHKHLKTTMRYLNISWKSKVNAVEGA